MEKLSRIWKTSSTDDSATVTPSAQGRKVRVRPPTVDEIRDDQPANPYREIQLLAHHTDIIRFLIRINDSCCLTAGDDGSIVIWDVTLGKKILVLQGHTRPITCTLVVRRETVAGIEDFVLMTAAADRQIRVWNVNTGACLQILTKHCSYVKCLVSMKNDDLFISAGEKVCVWNKNGELLSSHSDNELGTVNFMIAIQNDRLVIAYEKQLIVYQLTDESDESESGWRLIQCTKLLPHREAINCLVNISHNAFASGSLDGTLVIWGSHTLSRCRNFNSKPEYQDVLKSFPYSVQYVFSMDDHYVFAAMGSGFHVYDLSGQILAEKTNAHYSKIIHMAFVYNGAFLATCSEDGSIRLWQAGRCPRDKGANLSIVERFLGLTREELTQFRGDHSRLEPLLVGECLGHSGAVLNLMDFGSEGFVSCGVDELAILWKDGVVQSMKRTQIAHELINSYNDSL